jgi:uncharacterized protein YsxB (DUF464 family)
MLTIVFRRDSRKRLSSVLADGHAEWADAGADLVCAAASAIVQTAQLGLEQHARVSPAVEREEGCMRIAVPAAARDREDVRAILGTAELAIAQLARQFPDNIRYVTEDETVDPADFG